MFSIMGFVSFAEKNMLGASLCVAWLFIPIFDFIIDHLGKSIIKSFNEDKVSKAKLKKAVKTLEIEIKALENEITELESLKKPYNENYMKLVDTRFLENYIKTIKNTTTEVRKEERRARLNAYENRSRLGSQQLREQELNDLEIPYQCPYCENFSERNNLQLDHIFPISLGGLSMRQNVILVCSECNQRKSDKTLQRFARENYLNFEEICSRLETRGKIV